MVGTGRKYGGEEKCRQSLAENLKQKASFELQIDGRIILK
jgi:hypothetical protein